MFPSCLYQNGVNFLRRLALQGGGTWWQLAYRCFLNRARRLTCFLSASVTRKYLQFGTWTDPSFQRHYRFLPTTSGSRSGLGLISTLSYKIAPNMQVNSWMLFLGFSNLQGIWEFKPSIICWSSRDTSIHLPEATTWVLRASIADISWTNHPSELSKPIEKAPHTRECFEGPSGTSFRTAQNTACLPSRSTRESHSTRNTFVCYITATTKKKK